MKTKIIRKILAFAIAVSTVASMPGLVSAMPKKSTTKQNEDEKQRCIETVERALIECDADVPGNVYFKNSAFVDCVEFLSRRHRDVFKNFSQEEMTKILCFLHEFVKFDGYYKFKVMEIIQSLSDVRFSKEGIIKILDILHECRNDFNAFNINNIFQKSRDSYVGAENEIFKKTADVFLYLAEDPSKVSDVFYLIYAFMFHNVRFFDYCTTSQFEGIIDKFCLLIEKKETIYNDDLAIVKELANHPKLRTCSSKTIMKFKDVIINLINDKRFLNSKHIKPAVCIAELFKTGILSNLEKQQTEKIIDELLKYSQDHIKIPINIFERKSNNGRFDNNSKYCEKPGAYNVSTVYSKSVSYGGEDIVSEVFPYFGSNIYINNLKTDSHNAKKTATIIKNLVCCPAFDRSNLNLIGILGECVKTEEAREAVLAAIAHMAYRPDFSADIKMQMPKVVEILNMCSKDDDQQLAISSIIAELAQADLLKEILEDDVLKIINILSICAKSDDASKNVMFSLEKMLLSLNASPDVIEQMLDLLYRLSSKASDTRNIVSIVEYLTFSEAFKNLKPNAKPTLTLIRILKQCCGDNQTQAAAKIIEKLANSNCIEYGSEFTPLINDILAKCSNNEFAREHVANSIEKLLTNAHISTLSDKSKSSNVLSINNYLEISRTLKILNNCLTDCYGDVALKVLSSVNLIKTAYDNVQNTDEVWVIKSLIDLLSNCADNNIVKRDCVKFINGLVVNKCFSSYYLSSTVSLLEKCVEYAPAKEDVLVAVQNLVDKGYFNPNNAYLYRDKIFSLLFNCSEGDNKEIFDMIRKKLFPN